jgi:hypothetical protein
MNVQAQIRDFVVLQCKEKQVVNLFQGDFVYKGNFESYESSQNSVRIGLNRVFSLLGGNKIEVQFESGSKYCFFYSTVINVSGQKVFLALPEEIVIHLSRGAVRINVEKQNLECNLSLPFSLADRFARAEKDPTIEDKSVSSLHRELSRPQPRIPEIVKVINSLMLQRADEVKIILNGTEQPFFPAMKVFEKLQKPLFITDTTDATGLQRWNEESVLYAIFRNYLQLENQIPLDQSMQGRGAEYWAEQIKIRDVLQEVYIPIIIQNTVTGWVYACIKPGSSKSIVEEDIYYFMSLVEIISEALIMRALSARRSQESFKVRMYDVSETGLCLSVTDPVFVKLLRFDTPVKITFVVFGNPITLAAKVVRALNQKDEKEFTGFTITVDLTNTASQDKVWYRRFINHLQTQGGGHA